MSVLKLEFKCKISCRNRLGFSYIFIQIAETYNDSVSQTHFNTKYFPLVGIFSELELDKEM